MCAKKRLHTLTVYTGPMKSAKTLNLIQAYLHAQAAKRTMQAFRPSSDTRHTAPVICTRFGEVCVPATLVKNSDEILTKLKPETTIVLIDEAQFFDDKLPAVIIQVLNQADVGAAGLDLDFRGKPFGTVPQLMALADVVHKYTSACTVCGEPARFTQRKVNGKPSRASEPEVMPEQEGLDVVYEPRCRACYKFPR